MATFTCIFDSHFSRGLLGCRIEKGGVKELMQMIRKSNFNKEAEPEVKNKGANMNPLLSWGHAAQQH